MKRLAVFVAALSLAFAGVDAASAAGAYELTVVPPPTAAVSPGFFRINVATGQVFDAWGNSTKFAPVPDAAPLPPGDYHLHLAEARDGKGGWYLDRMDSQSGRTWYVSGGGGSAPFVWNEVTAPQ